MPLKRRHYSASAARAAFDILGDDIPKQGNVAPNPATRSAPGSGDPDERVLLGEVGEFGGIRVDLRDRVERGSAVRVSHEGASMAATVVDVRESITSASPPPGPRLDALLDVADDDREVDPLDVTRTRRIILCVDHNRPLEPPTATFLDDADGVDYLHVTERCTVTTLYRNEVVDFRGVYCGREVAR